MGGASRWTTGAALAFVLAAAPAWAREARFSFDIPAGDAEAALRDFARQTGMQILFPYELVSGRRTPALVGDFTPSQAAERLGAALGLTVRSADARTLTLGPAPPRPLLRPAPRPPPPATPAPLPPPPPLYEPPAPPGLLQEVVVTATRQPERLNRVPISMTASTAETLEQQGVKQAGDMQASVPALILSQLTPGLANVAIRGVTDTGSGAATTGFYLDDTPLQKRNAGGVRNGSGNGTPLPPLFDVERVEVLRGPQGTLFGAGSEGGTVRYITAQPDLDRPRLYVRTEASTTAGGQPSGELGVAVSLPLVPERLALRLTAYQRNTGGFLDYVDPYTSGVRFHDANSGRTRLFRAAATLALSPEWKATASLYASSDHWGSASSTYTPSMPNAIVVPTQCYDTRGVTPAQPQNNPQPVPCGGPGVTFRRPGLTYGPYPALGPGRTLAKDRVPSTTTLFVPTLTVDYAGGGFSAKSITSYLVDRTRYVNLDNLSQIRDSRSNAAYGPIWIPRGFTLAGDYPDAWRNNGHFDSHNRRRGLSEEIRFTSPPDARPLTWVGGVFYSNLKTWQSYDNIYERLDALAGTLYGLTAAQRYGVGPYLVGAVASGFDHKDQTFRDTEIAGFGELNYWATPRLRLTVGVRASRMRFNYTEHHYGPASGFNTPTPENGGGPNTGSTTETPIAPKFSAQYLIGASDMVYVTAAKGFRAGGVNANLPMAICGAGLAQYGMTSEDVPRTYSSDSVWSYEAGGKLRLADGRLQLNAAAYRIDWRDAQLTVDVGNNCGIPFISNAGAARSQGVELEAQGHVARLTLDLGVSYDDARYIEDAVATRRGSTPLVIALKDERLSIPPWTLRLGARYDFRLAGLAAYARADWYVTAGYDHAAPQTYGVPAYAPDALIPDTGRINLRLGVDHDGLEASVFATNLLNSAGGAITGGRSGCALPSVGGTAACATYATFNPFLVGTPATAPRQVGLQLVYRR